MMQSQFYTNLKSSEVMYKIFYFDKKSKNLMKFYSSQIIKLLKKTWEVFNWDFFNTKKNPNIENFIFYLINLLNS